MPSKRLLAFRQILTKLLISFCSSFGFEIQNFLTSDDG